MRSMKSRTTTRNTRPPKEALRRQRVKSALIWTSAALTAVGLTGFWVFHGLKSQGHVHLPIIALYPVLFLVSIAIWKIVAIWWR